MPGGAAPVSYGGYVDRIEAPVTFAAYFTCVFASFGGILFGYDSGYINGIYGMDIWKNQFGRPTGHSDDPIDIATWQKSLTTSILSAGTFVGALVAGDLADRIGRRFTIILACAIFCAGVIIQVASQSINVLIGGRVVAGLGVGLISATVILYVSEIAPKKIRGAIVSGYQFAITVGILLAGCVAQATKDRKNSGAYRIPIAIQFLWALILAIGLIILPESPRFYVKKGRNDRAAKALSRVRGQPESSEYIQAELAEIVANYEYEMTIATATWLDCFKGGLRPSGNLFRVLVGTGLQMFQQLTGVNFIFYYSTTFFQQSGIKDPFLISIATDVVNVGSTPLSWWAIERFGRRKLLIWGASLMLVCEFIVGGVGTALPNSSAAGTCLIVFTCIYIFGFATTWGPAAWVVIGEIFPLPIRAKGVALSTASNWLWNFVLAFVTPYMVDPDKGDLQQKVFFVWGSCCTLCLIFAYFMVPETKGLSLEQVDRMLEETTPRTSAGWVPHDTFAGGDHKLSEKEAVEHV
ncbi:MSTA protein [Punctularia strigosozonata HHB-11173 SS5]|uniref:MSTA protein n=1 Tax=Punctularia strigosozonata (strain HHB-11173) TaxID=741275 RepID=UPI0004417E5A|nr:MSTA protein [Punctularia strigosozonata HHB-11173 SS5]EIN06028.1 MSTA protein [Punctularia strigosozonata HHB-11173 SS5]